MHAAIYRVIELGLRVTAYLQWLGPLLARLFVGCLFLLSGWGKVHKLAWFGSLFAGWGIPYPSVMASVTAYTELIGGALILVGLLTRIVAIPMIINMLVAITVVKLKEVHSVLDFVSTDEPLYAIALIWLMLDGAGSVSFDYLLEKMANLPGWSHTCDH
jgi:putative oxidoreductase